jgi:hypothetical protein
MALWDRLSSPRALAVDVASRCAGLEQGPLERALEALADRGLGRTAIAPAFALEPLEIVADLGRYRHVE